MMSRIRIFLPFGGRLTPQTPQYFAMRNTHGVIVIPFFTKV